MSYWKWLWKNVRRNWQKDDEFKLIIIAISLPIALGIIGFSLCFITDIAWFSLTPALTFIILPFISSYFNYRKLKEREV